MRNIYCKLCVVELIIIWESFNVKLPDKLTKVTDRVCETCSEIFNQNAVDHVEACVDDFYESTHFKPGIHGMTWRIPVVVMDFSFLGRRGKLATNFIRPVLQEWWRVLKRAHFCLKDPAMEIEEESKGDSEGDSEVGHSVWASRLEPSSRVQKSFNWEEGSNNVYSRLMQEG